MKNFPFALLIAVLTSWFNAPVSAQSLKMIRIGYPSISSRQAQLWVAKDEGLFRKYGLDVELIFLRGGQVAIQALTGGDPPIVTIGNVIIANLQGHDIVLVQTGPFRRSNLVAGFGKREVLRRYGKALSSIN